MVFELEKRINIWLERSWLFSLFEMKCLRRYQWIYFFELKVLAKRNAIQSLSMFGLIMELEPKIMHNLLLQTPETERAAGEW